MQTFCTEHRAYKTDSDLIRFGPKLFRTEFPIPMNAELRVKPIQLNVLIAFLSNTMSVCCALHTHLYIQFIWLWIRPYTSMSNRTSEPFEAPLNTKRKHLSLRHLLEKRVSSLESKGNPKKVMQWLS